MKTAIILAAGFGTRMRPLTEKIPKPLVPICGKPLIDYALDSLAKASFEKIVVNVHYLPDQIIEHLSQEDRFDIKISHETEQILDSGGGTLEALNYFDQSAKKSPFMLLNADTFWIEGADQDIDNLSQMIASFNPAMMDILMLLAPIHKTTGHTSGADFKMDAQKRLTRFPKNHHVRDEDLIYAGAIIMKPEIFSKITKKVFSLNQCFDDAIAKGRLYGHLMNGRWITVGTMAAIQDAEAVVSAHKDIDHVR